MTEAARPPRLRAPLAAAVVAVAAVLAGCSGPGTDSTSSESGGGAVQPAPPASALQEKADSSPQKADTSTESARGDADAGKSGERTSSNGTTLARAKVTTRSIVRTADLLIRTKNVRTATDRAASLVAGVDGYVANQQSATDPDTERTETTSVNLVLRVPVEEFDRITRQLQQLGTVLSDKKEATDVTEEVVDVESRITSQKKSIERLRALLAEANTVGEVMQVESELATREADLEALQSRYAALSSQAALSTIRVTFQSPPRAAEPLDDEQTDSGFLAGLRSGWNAFVTVVQFLLTALGALLPFLLVLALILGVPGWRYFRARARRGTPAVETPPGS
ncbi:DUF4349 domain-containing protein [Actinopolymorpha alba]|uniref:DUF4349 domain-containing protein n=1 Tax=Actinopolymorpha alba TaxID=533267 RepID=UPI00036BD305|nr:DUF4349 domain-containing protein [Actinopolymorpha alba]